MHKNSVLPTPSSGITSGHTARPVVEVVKGKQLAESTLQRLEAYQNSSDHFEGWRYFMEKTDQKPGINSAEATQQRQKELEVRESKAMQETKTSVIPSDTQQ